MLGRRMKKLILILLIAVSTCFIFADDTDTVNIKLAVASVGPIGFFSDSPVSSVDATAPDFSTKPLTRNEGSGASGEIYAVIITNQPVTVSIGWDDLATSATTTTLPLSASSTSCTVTKAGGSAGSATTTNNTTVSTSTAVDAGSTEYSLSLVEPKGTASGTRVICHKIDLSISEESYLAANAADDYSTTMSLYVSAP